MRKLIAEGVGGVGWLGDEVNDKGDKWVSSLADLAGTQVIQKIQLHKEIYEDSLEDAG